jgi:hypothetical protein
VIDVGKAVSLHLPREETWRCQIDGNLDHAGRPAQTSSPLTAPGHTEPVAEQGSVLAFAEDQHHQRLVPAGQCLGAAAGALERGVRRPAVGTDTELVPWYLGHSRIGNNVEPSRRRFLVRKTSSIDGSMPVSRPVQTGQYFRVGRVQLPFLAKNHFDGRLLTHFKYIATCPILTEITSVSHLVAVVM